MACLGFKNCFFVNYRLATARHGVRSAKLLNFLFTFKDTRRFGLFTLLYIVHYKKTILCQSDDVALRLQRHLDGGFLVHVLLVEQQQAGAWQRIKQIVRAVLRG